MKKTILRLLAAAMVLCLVPALSLALDFATVKGGSLILREEPGTYARNKGVYETGAWVQVNGAAGNGWYAVRTMDGRTGYMLGTYLNFAQDGGSGVTVKYAQGGYVNLRSGPSLDYSIVKRVTSGTSVTILDDSYEWNYVSVAGSKGYIHDSLLQKGSASSTIVTKNGGKVNVRTGPASSYYGTVGSLSTGTRVDIRKKGNGWYLISANGLTGFVSTQYISGSGGGGGGQSTTAWVSNPGRNQVLLLRERPSQSARVLGDYRNGTQVKVISYGATWCEVSVGSKHGYMMTRYLSFKKPSVDPTPYYPVYPTATPYHPVYPTATPKPYYPTPTVEYITPVPPYNPPAGTQGTLAVAAGTGQTSINVYFDAGMTQFKASYAPATKITILQYSASVTMILVDGGVGYVSTWNVNY